MNEQAVSKRKAPWQRFAEEYQEKYLNGEVPPSYATWLERELRNAEEQIAALEEALAAAPGWNGVIYG